MWVRCRYFEEIGSEGGIVLLDEEYNQTCRITLEYCRRYYAITCGVYGDMVHTAFCDKTNYLENYQSMKNELQRFIDDIYQKETRDGRSEFYEYFIEKYW